jgi:3-phenylpropionate/cinnamic acid dioxygenase small subunit
VESDEDRIRTTIAQYCHFCDDGRWDEWLDLYAPEAQFTVMGRTYEGHEELRAFIENAQPPERRGKHMTFNSVVEVDGDAARAWTDFAFLARTPDGMRVATAGRYHDRFRRDADRWRFTERRIVFPGEGG